MARRISQLSYVFPGILVGLTVIAVGISLWLWEDVKNDRFNDLSYTAQILDEYYSLTFNQRELGLKSVGQRMLDYPGEEGRAMRMEIGLEAIELWEEFLAIGLTLPNGKSITFTGDPSGSTEVDLLSETHTRRSFLKALESEHLSIGEPYYFKEISDWILPVRVPIRNAKGELAAVNTSAIDFKRIIANLESFGLDSVYRIHMVNSDFNTTHYYYPLDIQDYEKLMRKSAALYSDTTLIEENEELTFFSGLNSFEDNNVIGVITDPGAINYYLVITVDRQVIWNDFFGRFNLLLFIYLLLITIVFITYQVFRRNEVIYDQTIREEQEYSLSLIDQSPSMIIGIDGNGICRFMNPAAEEMTGYSRQELIGQSWWDTLYPGKLKDQVSERINSIQNERVINYEMTMATKDGEHRIVSWNSMTRFDNRGGVNQVIGFGNDITDLKESQEQLERYTHKLEELVRKRTEELEISNSKLQDQNNELAEQRKELEDTLANLKKTQRQLLESEKMASLGILSAGIGHEINNPLNFIKGGLDGLIRAMENSDDDQDVQPFLNAIREGIDRAANIVKSLGHFGKSGESNDETCDLIAILENCLVVLGNLITGKIEVEKNYPKQAEVLGNEGKLHQVFLNILTNAVQAIDNKGKITISIESVKKEVLVRIADTGSGIPEENMRRISDPFFTTKPPGEATGLGLYLVYSMVHDHKGNVEVHSVVGEGTEFTISLPLKKHSKNSKSESKRVSYP